MILEAWPLSCLASSSATAKQQTAKFLRPFLPRVVMLCTCGRAECGNRTEIVTRTLAHLFFYYF